MTTNDPTPPAPITPADSAPVPRPRGVGARSLGVALLAAGLLAVPAAWATGTATAENTDERGYGYVLQLGENGYEHHWVQNPDRSGYYYHDGEMHWNPGK
ncbi:hypothetical protein [Nocardia sp. CC227C]|uniref:hypothetical protein n=1 Tax=Nocardia sp. CC227C TaxID=3044562 RepID=UPI00278C29A9|nr:hypothetical protein [Nocardia sp. CC227C]